MQKEVFSTFSQLLNGFPLKPFFTLAHSGVNQPFIREQLVFFQPLKNLLLTLVKRRGVFEQGLQSICLKRRQKITKSKEVGQWSDPKDSGQKVDLLHTWDIAHQGRNFLKGEDDFCHIQIEDCSTTKVFLEQFKKLLAKLFPPPFLAVPFSFHLIDQ